MNQPLTPQPTSEDSPMSQPDPLSTAMERSDTRPAPAPAPALPSAESDPLAVSQSAEISQTSSIENPTLTPSPSSSPSLEETPPNLPPPLTPRSVRVEEPTALQKERALVERLTSSRVDILRELSKVIVGQQEIIEQILISLMAGGHCLITGAPGLAKTLLVKSVARIFHLKFQRIQFTPDLMPADITGTEILQDTGEGRQLTFVKGPIFANMLLADEINRTPPKTQAALLEAMQELQVTAAGIRHPLAPPFFVLATQNPVEMEGTYPLPEAQLDRFMFNVVMDYLPEEDEIEVVVRTTAGAIPAIEALYQGEDVLAFHKIVRQVPVAEELVRHAVRIAAASRPNQAGTPAFIQDWVTWGAGVRAGQFLVLGAKARALLRGRFHVTAEDIRALARPILRHRILLNYRAEAEGVTPDSIIEQLLDAVPSPTKR